MKLPLFSVYIDQFYSKGATDAVYLLSHFHTDHMKGLSPLWSAGLIISDAVTQALLIQTYGAAMEKRTMALPLFQRIPLLQMTTKHSSSEASLNGVEKSNVFLNHINNTCNDGNSDNILAEEGAVALYLLPAFHIPGSVMFFFETPYGNILYTGDFKYNEHARRRLDPFFANHRVDHVYLDDTWLHLGISEVVSPFGKGNDGTRVLSKMLSETELEEAVEAVGRRMDRRVRDFAMEAKHSNEMSGPYVLRVYLHNHFGKEHLVQRLAARLSVPVVVDEVRYERIRLLASFNESIAEMDESFCMDSDRFVLGAHCSAYPRIEIVSSRKQISPEELRSAAERNGGTPHYGIVMSGWALFRRRSNGTTDEPSVWEIPTTLHSTPQQIIDFVALLHPMSVTPLHYKPCRAEVVLQRLGPFLRQPYMNRLLSMSDGVNDGAVKWRRCIAPVNDAKETGRDFFPPKRSGFCIGSSFVRSSSSPLETAFNFGEESPSVMDRQKRKRPQEMGLSPVKTSRHDDSSLSAEPSLTQLAEFLDL